jgi:hypothetical protein
VKNTLANRWREQKADRKAKKERKKEGEEIVSYWTALRELHNYRIFKKSTIAR